MIIFLKLNSCFESELVHAALSLHHALLNLPKDHKGVHVPLSAILHTVLFAVGHLFLFEGGDAVVEA